MDKKQLLREISEDCLKLQDTLNRVQSGLDRLQKNITKELQSKTQMYGSQIYAANSENMGKALIMRD